MKFVLRLRAEDGLIFSCLKNGSKSIDTRAATAKYRNIKSGDTLVFVCGGKKLSKQVKEARRFKTIPGLKRALKYKKIMPWLKSSKDMEKEYYKFSGYKEKIKKFGLIAFEFK